MRAILALEDFLLLKSFYLTIQRQQIEFIFLITINLMAIMYRSFYKMMPDELR
jgi:hypothetical protein